MPPPSLETSSNRSRALPRIFGVTMFYVRTASVWFIFITIQSWSKLLLDGLLQKKKKVKWPLHLRSDAGKIDVEAYGNRGFCGAAPSFAWGSGFWASGALRGCKKCSCSLFQLQLLNGALNDGNPEKSPGENTKCSVKIKARTIFLLRRSDLSLVVLGGADWFCFEGHLRQDKDHFGLLLTKGHPIGFGSLHLYTAAVFQY